MNNNQRHVLGGLISIFALTPDWGGLGSRLSRLIVSPFVSASHDKVVKSTVYLSSAADFSAMNVAYRKLFDAVQPARTTIQAVPPNEAALI